MVSTAFYLGKEKLRHSLGRPSRSDFVQFKFVTEVFAMKEIKIELLGIAIILLGIVLRANSFFEYFLGVFGFGIVVSGCFLKDKYK